MKQLSIIIVNYRRCQLLGACLASIAGTRSDSELEVFVVNNGSPGELELLSPQRQPWVHLIQNPANFGFAAAVNIGFRASRRDFVLVLNPDVFVGQQSLEILLDTLRCNGDAAIALPRLNNSDGTLQYSCRRFYTFTTLMMRRAPLNKIVPDHPAVREHLMLDWDHQSLSEVDWGLGAAMLVRRAAIGQADLFDERFFLYFEDVDLCLRMCQQGWRVLYNPAAIMVHQHQRESGQPWNYGAKRHHFFSLMKFLWKHRGKLHRELRPEREKSSALQSRRS